MVVHHRDPDTTKPTVTSADPGRRRHERPGGHDGHRSVQRGRAAGHHRVHAARRRQPGRPVDHLLQRRHPDRDADADRALANSATYTATLNGATDSAGNVMDPVTWSFTTEAAETVKPTVTSRTPAAGRDRVAGGHDGDRGVQRGRPGRHDRLRPPRRGDRGGAVEHQLQRDQPHRHADADGQPCYRHDVHRDRQRGHRTSPATSWTRSPGRSRPTCPTPPSRRSRAGRRRPAPPVWPPAPR